MSTIKDTGLLGKGGCWPILAITIVLLLTVGIVVVMASPTCYTLQVASSYCDGSQATVTWTGSNYWGEPLKLHVGALDQIQTRTLPDGHTATGIFYSDLALLPSGTVTFTWALASHQDDTWNNVVSYPAINCNPTAVTLSNLSATRRPPPTFHLPIRKTCVQTCDLVWDAAGLHYGRCYTSFCFGSDTR